MTMIRHTNRTFLLLAACLFAAGAAVQAQAQSASPKAVELTPDACAQISQGDVLVFHWNPVFDPAGAVYGVNEFQLYFLPHAEVSTTRSNRGFKLILSARPRDGDETEPRGIIHGPNGIVEMRFHPNLLGILPGEYDLVDTLVTPRVDSGYQGSTPKMTNSPLRYRFCLNIVSPPGRGR